MAEMYAHDTGCADRPESVSAYRPSKLDPGNAGVRKGELHNVTN